MFAFMPHWLFNLIHFLCREFTGTSDAQRGGTAQTAEISPGIRSLRAEFERTDITDVALRLQCRRGPLGLSRCLLCLLLVAGVTGWSGCGTTKTLNGTEQLLLSDAVDNAIGRIDFTPLRDQKVFFETKFIKDYKGIGFVNADYVISALRQQMVASGLQLQEKADTADFVIEGRVGALGSDAHDVIYGIPASSILSDAAKAAAAFGQAPPVPGIPELAVAKRSSQVAAAKIAVFAYEAESKERVWQSGTMISKADERNMWILGVGPFQQGTLHQGDIGFAGKDIELPILAKDSKEEPPSVVKFHGKRTFLKPPTTGSELPESVEDSLIQQVSGETPTPAPKSDSKE